MPNIFEPKANSLAKLTLILGAAVPVLAITLGSAISRSPSNTGVGNPLLQPVPFSHKHHAWELGIDCRYCHKSVETSAKASLPTTETCMTCHSQIWTNSPLLDPVRKSYETGQPIKWAVANKVPEFVYFDHSIHVNKGVSCNNCHGAVQKMNLVSKGRAFFMVWCLQCHNSPEKYMYKDETRPDLTPRQQVFNLYKKFQADPDGHNMTQQERNAMKGDEQVGVDPKLGEQLVKERNLVKAQMKDCTVCHR